MVASLYHSAMVRDMRRCEKIAAWRLLVGWRAESDACMGDHSHRCVARSLCDLPSVAPLPRQAWCERLSYGVCRSAISVGRWTQDRECTHSRSICALTRREGNRGHRNVRCHHSSLIMLPPAALCLSRVCVCVSDIWHSWDDGVTWRATSVVGGYWAARWSHAMWSYEGILTLAFGATANGVNTAVASQSRSETR
jgi:hypothetical protein